MTRRRPPEPQERMAGAQRQMTPGTLDGWVRNTATGAAIGQAGSPSAGGSSYTAAVVFARDRFAITAGGAQDVTLTYVPLANSPHVYLNGLHLDEGGSADYTRDSRTVSLLAGAGLVSGDVVDVRYAYYSGAPSEVATLPEYLLFDDFERTDYTLGDPVIGATPTTWQQHVGGSGWMCYSGVVVPTLARDEHRIYWDVGATEYTLTVDVVTLPAVGGVGVRGDGDGTDVYVSFEDTVIKIITRDDTGGSTVWTTRATSAAGSPCVSGMTATVEVSESAVTASTSTGLSVTWTSSIFSDQTQVLLWAHDTEVAAFNDIRVTSP